MNEILLWLSGLGVGTKEILMWFSGLAAGMWLWSIIQELFDKKKGGE